jgi:hypothetical protein
MKLRLKSNRNQTTFIDIIRNKFWLFGRHKNYKRKLVLPFMVKVLIFVINFKINLKVWLSEGITGSTHGQGQTRFSIICVNLIYASDTQSDGMTATNRVVLQKWQGK